MKKIPKSYLFQYDPETFLYKGITRDLKEPFTTDVEPIYETGSRTLWDTKNKKWFLVDREEFWRQISVHNNQLNFESDIKDFILEHVNRVIDNLYQVTDRNFSSIERDIRHTEKLVEYGNNQELKHRADLAHQITGLAEQTQILLRAVNNLNTQITHVKFELEIPWYKKLLRWLFTSST